jgi:polyisoprenoid-binding protein YceI
MRKLLTVVMIYLCPVSLSAQHFILIDSASSVHFDIKNFGILVSGTFKGLHGKISFDPNDPRRSQIQAAVVSASIDTGISLRDKHLKKEEYFDAWKHPLLEFSSRRVYQNDNGTWMVNGVLSIKGVSREISFPFRFSNSFNGYRFTAKFKINRTDFGIGEKNFGLSNDVMVRLNVSARPEMLAP